MKRRLRTSLFAIFMIMIFVIQIVFGATAFALEPDPNLSTVINLEESDGNPDALPQSGENPDQGNHQGSPQQSEGDDQNSGDNQAQGDDLNSGDNQAQGDNLNSGDDQAQDDNLNSGDDQAQDDDLNSGDNQIQDDNLNSGDDQSSDEEIGNKKPVKNKLTLSNQAKADVIDEDPAALDDREPDSFPMDMFITGAIVETKIENTWYNIMEMPLDMTIEKNAQIRVKLTYNPSLNTGVSYVSGDLFTFNVPSHIVPNADQYGKVFDGGTVVGEYIIKTNGTIEVTLTNKQYLESTAGNLKNGTLSFMGHFADDVWEDGGSTNLEFGGITVVIPPSQEELEGKGTVKVTKTAGNNKKIAYDAAGKYWYIDYTVKVEAPADNTKKMENITVTDVFEKGSAYVDSLINVSATKGTFDTSAKVWTVGDMTAGQKETLTFRAKLKDSIVEAGAVATRTIKNVATVKTGSQTLNTSSVETTAKSAINIKKTNTGYNRENGTVTYTVTVTTPSSNSWDLHNVTVKDAFGTNKSYVIEYDTTTPTTGVVTNDTNKTLDWTIGTMQPGQTKTLTYTVKIDDAIFLSENDNYDVSRTLKNTATVYVKGTSKGTANSTVDFRKVWIWKNGTLQNDGRVQFVIHANETTGGAPVMGENLVFTDSLKGDWVYDGNLQIRWYQQGPDSKGSVIGSTTVNIDGKTSWEWRTTGKYYYEFEYYARLKDSVIGTPSISNTAGIGVGIGGKTYNHEYSWEGTGKNYDGLNKEFVSLNGNIATWTSKIICNVPQGTVYYDWRDSDGTWIMTDGQLDKIQVGGAGAGKSYTVERYNTNYFKITFNEKIEASPSNPVTITYNTILDTSGVAEGKDRKYVNKSKLVINGHEDAAQAECTYTQEQRLLKTAGSYDKATGIMTWNIQVNLTGTMSGDAVLVDTLPEGLEFVEAAITERGSKASQTSMTTSHAGNVVTMNLTGLNASNDKNASVTITLKTKVVDKKFLTMNGEKTFTNTAQLNYNGTVNESSAQQEISNVAMTKEGVYNQNTAPYAEYIITVNPNGIDMLDGATTINVTDTMGQGLMLNVGTMTVVNTKTGESVPYKNLIVKGNVFTMDIPDDQPLTIRYSAYVTGEIGSQASIVNTVNFTANGNYGGTEDKNEVVILESNATLEGATAIFIAKKDSATNAPLPGAEYTLYQVTDSGKIGDAIRTVVSDNMGTVTFTNLDATAVYAFKETKAPNGYYIDEENAAYTYIAFSEVSIKEGMKDLDVIVVQKGASFDRFNKKGEITVNKKFVGDAADGTYYFGLFNKQGTLVTLNNEAAVVSCQVDDGKVVANPVFRGVPFGEYSIYETDANGSKLDSDGDGIIAANATRYKVTGDGTEVVVYAENPVKTVNITNTSVPLEITLQATKGFKNENAAASATFTFQLMDAKGKVISEEETEGSGTITFEKLTFTKEDIGTHTYKIREVVPQQDNSNIEYDTTTYQVVITISSTENGLAASVVIDGETTLTETNGVYALPEKREDAVSGSFINKYDAETSVQFEGTKTLENANYDLTENLFQFEITGPNLIDENGNSVSKLIVGHNADGTIAYPEIIFTLEDLKGNSERTFEYNIKEVAGTAGGIVYDTTTHKVIVKVTNDGEKMTAEAADGYSMEGLDFTNTYSASGTAELNGTKTLNGETLQADAFEFVLTETTDGVNAPYIDSAKNDADGRFVLNLPTYTEADHGKTFTYTVTETAETKDGLHNDDTVYQVSVSVTDNMEGELELEVLINEEADAAIVFENEFNGSVILTKTNGKSGSDYAVLSGAEFTLYKIVGTGSEEIGSYVTDQNGELTADNLDAGNYYFVETKAPAGYDIIKDKDGEKLRYYFELGLNGGQAVGKANIIVANEQKLGTLKLKKTGAHSDVLQGVEFTLYRDDEVYQTGLRTDADGMIVVESLPWGSYYFVETETADGYVLDTTKTETVVIDAAYVDGDILTVEKTNEQTKIAFAKVDKETQDLIAGAELELLDSNGNVVEAWTSSTEAHVVEGLTVGESYTLREVTPPAGYATAEDVTFTVEDTAELITITMEDEQTKIAFAKVDKETQDLIAGAELELLDSDGNVVESWTSTTEAHVIVGKLVAGEGYTLREVTPPAGYATAEDVTFTVEDTAELITITMEDEQTRIAFAKVDKETQDLIAGAELELLDSDGNVVASWTSTTEAHEIVGKLVAGEGYTLRETTPPAGYATAEEVTFTVEDTAELITITMEDEKTKIAFAKVDKETQDLIAGAKLELLDSNGDVVEAWTSATEAHEMEGLTVGESYTLREVTPPAGYATAEDVTFTVEDTAELITITMEDEKTKIAFAKVDKETQDLIAGAELELLDSDGNVVASWTSTTEAHVIVGKLVAGEGYTLREVTPPAGYATAEDVTFTVEDTAELITITMEDELTELSISKTDITGEEAIPGAVLEIREKETNDLVDTWVSEEEAHTITGKLIAGKAYVLIETEAPVGYRFLAENIEFTVEPDGTITTTAPMADGVLQVRNEELHFHVNKVSVIDQKELAGAELTVIDKETGSVVANWISEGDKPYDFGEYLTAGKEYILRETVAPDGYAYVTDAEFTVNKDGSIETALITTTDEEGNLIHLVEDDTTKVVVKKVDEAGKLLKDAELAILDAETGEIAASWTTDGKASKIEGVLIAGKEYILREVKAPNGYNKADDITFTVPTEAEVMELEMIDEAIPAESYTGPQTGDSRNITSWIVLMSISSVCVAGVAVTFIIFRRK